MANWDCVKSELHGKFRCISKTIFNIKNMSEGWKIFMREQIKKEYLKTAYKKLKINIIDCYNKGINIYPDPDNVLKIFKLVPLEKIKVVIIGQDPYFKISQAHGLSFSVPDGVISPPSLKTIFNELKTEYENFQIPKCGNLTKWTTEGVFLLNSSLSVINNKPNSHMEYWYEFTDEVIKYISEKNNGVVFMLWGNFAKGKAELIDSKKHKIIISGHPSPMNTTNPFIGCNCFKECNKYLENNNKEIINWNL